MGTKAKTWSDRKRCSWRLGRNRYSHLSIPAPARKEHLPEALEFTAEFETIYGVGNPENPHETFGEVISDVLQRYEEEETEVPTLKYKKAYIWHGEEYLSTRRISMQRGSLREAIGYFKQRFGLDGNKVKSLKEIAEERTSKTNIGNKVRFVIELLRQKHKQDLWERALELQ